MFGFLITPAARAQARAAFADWPIRTPAWAVWLLVLLATVAFSEAVMRLAAGGGVST